MTEEYTGQTFQPHHVQQYTVYTVGVLRSTLDLCMFMKNSRQQDSSFYRERNPITLSWFVSDNKH